MQKSSINRQSPDANSGCGKNGVGHRRRDEHCAQLADTGGGFQTARKVYVNFRRFIDAQYLIVVKIALFDGTIFDSDLGCEYRREGKIDTALGHAPGEIALIMGFILYRLRNETGEHS